MYCIPNKKYIISVSGKNPPDRWSSQMISIIHVVHYPGCTFKQVLAGMVASLYLSFNYPRICLQKSIAIPRSGAHICDIIKEWCNYYIFRATNHDAIVLWESLLLCIVPVIAFVLL